jgi:hypothetical protein
MFETPRFDEKMIRLILSPPELGNQPIKEAISKGNIPDGFKMVNGNELDRLVNPVIFALFLLTNRFSRYIGVFCLNYMNKIYMTIDMGDYITRTLNDYSKFG